MAAGFFHPRPGVPRRARLLAEDLFDPRDRLVDRLLGADALGGDPVDGFSPAPPPSRPFCQTLEQGGRGYGDSAALRGLRAFGAEGDDLYAHPAFGTSADDSLIRLDEFEFIA
jgi:hypothetical protein